MAIVCIASMHDHDDDDDDSSLIITANDDMGPKCLHSALAGTRGEVGVIITELNCIAVL